MTTNGEPTLLIAGYPKAGKTTYLAALWYILNHTDELDAGLRLHKLGGNDLYLNTIQDRWLQFIEVERTKLSQEKTIFLEVQDLSSQTILRLCWPDLSGERFDEQFEERRCSSDFVKLVTEATGCLLFIHSGRVTKSVSIEAAADAIKVLDSQGEDGALDKDAGSTEKPVPWDRTMPSVQVKAVELLQFIEYLRVSIEPFRLAVVLSAWDLIEKQHKTPLAFLKRDLPLLHQFLLANAEIFSWVVFGISSTGIELNAENKENVKKYAEGIYKPTDRIKVQSGDENESSHDLTLPIKWML